QQLARLEGLGNVVVDAGLEAFDALLGLGLGRQQAYRDVGYRLEVARQIEPAFARHHHVEDHDVEGEAAHGGACARRIRGRRHAKPVLEQVLRQEVANALIVVDDQDVRSVVGQRIHSPSGPRDERQGRPTAVAATVSGSSASTRARSSLVTMWNRKRAAASALPAPARASAWATRLDCKPSRRCARAAPFSVVCRSRWRRSCSPAFCSIQPWSRSCLRTRARLCLVIFRISSRSATLSPGLRLTKWSTR